MRYLSKPFVFTWLIGFSANACLSTLFVSVVSFSVFPWITCVLAAWIFYQACMAQEWEEDHPLHLLLSAVIGALCYTIMIRVAHPELGGAFFPILLVLIILGWMGYKRGWFNHPQDGE